MATSDGLEKMSLYVSTFGLRVRNGNEANVFTGFVRQNLSSSQQDFVDNIAKIKYFSRRILDSPKKNKNNGLHERIKQAILPKIVTFSTF